MLLTDPDLRGIDPADAVAEYHRRGLHRLADDELFDRAADVVSRPKAAPADSFVLHAPLELLARRALLGLARASEREAVRHRITWLAAAYETHELEGQATGMRARDPRERGLGVAGAVLAGDLDAVDVACRGLEAEGTVADVLGLADALVPSLAAAAHAPIFLELLPKVAPRSRAALGLLRPLAREVARNPSWRVTWIDDAPVGPGEGTEDDVVDALLDTPLLGRPGSDFIFPLMHQVDSTGTARAVVTAALRRAADPRAAARAMARVAALSMLQDDPVAAPYGWSHCLTMPQAVAAAVPHASDPWRTLAVAGTHVVGFRAALASPGLTVSRTWGPEPVAVDPVAALDADAPTAAAAAWDAPEERRADLVAAVAARAAAQEDAHLAKYVLACADAAAADPAHGHLFLAAAAYLTAWWGAPAPGA